jgi:RimJ/RimL family protein N-acetyltransferase
MAPTLTDGFVVLDQYTLDDVEAHLAGEDDEHARRFGWYPNRSTPETVQATIIRWQEHWKTGGPVRAFAIRSAETRGLVGGCEARRVDTPARRGCGFATRGARLLTEYVMTILRASRVELHIETDNLASRRVAQKAGFAEAGDVPAEQVRLDGSGRRPHLVRYVRSQTVQLHDHSELTARE